ncbi:MAG TPA: terminase [Dehalococcoidia bacterium]|nr:terminase [Dehalococcoidia bacterium]
MTILCVPPLEEEPWPTLGPQVCEFIEEYLIFGPGDLRGQPARIDDEKRALIYRMYEVEPDGPNKGRRRFRRVGLSLQKGSAKTELAAWIAACELHPDAPVRCVGWDSHGQPIGDGVNDPFIPIVAVTEEQSEELAYGTLLVVLSEGPLAGDFDIGLERIMRKRGDGKAVALATAPDARDGARTTFQVFDETHRFTLPRLKQAHRTMMANLPKRRLADPWALEVTTAPVPGEGSVAEATMDYARQVASGKIEDSRLFFFHRQASDGHDLSSLVGIRAAVIEAAGPMAAWKDIDAICDQFQDPTTDKSYLEQVWLNRPRKGSQQAFDAQRWRDLVKMEYQVAPGELITIGFDGARYEDATALVATEVETGYQWPLGIWEKPEHLDEWAVPEEEVDAIVTSAFERWNVWRMYADPYWWESWVAQWAGRWGDKRVLRWPTNRLSPMAFAVRSFDNAIAAGEISHNGHTALARHIGNARRRELTLKDGEGRPLWVIQKERPDSPHKIDGAMAAILSWEARNDAITAGATNDGGPSVYEERGLLVLN